MYFRTITKYGDDFVQCVPTRKGHQILYKDQLPDWVSIYFIKNAEKEYRCNICDNVVLTDTKTLELLEHLKTNHKEVHDLHKGNPEATMGFRVEFLQLDVLKDDGDPKSQPVILGEVCEAATEEIAETVTGKDDSSEPLIVLLPDKQKKQRREHARKRSWVWKYFDKLSNVIFRCSLCNVVLSIRGCNTNNMNRHIRTRHPSVYKSEMARKQDIPDMGDGTGEVKIEEISVADKDFDESFESPSQKHRRSWIWSYFTHISGTLAQCKLCSRNISHGGNATGNMNRHLKMIHHKTGEHHNWIWKVFDTEEEFYCCKICDYRFIKHKDIDKSISAILHHLNLEHGVISGSQIITGTDVEGDTELMNV